MDEESSPLLGDWDGDGNQDVLWFHWQHQKHRLSLELHSTKWQRTFRHEKQFPRWQLVGQEGTNELGDDIQHLLLVFYDGQKAHLLDGVFSKSQWKWSKLATFSVSKLSPNDRFMLHLGDADGDGDKDLLAQLSLPMRGTFLPSLPHPMSRFWFLRRNRQVWSVQAIVTKQNETIQPKHVGNRLWVIKEEITLRFVSPQWHYIYPHSVNEVITHLCTFPLTANCR